MSEKENEKDKSFEDVDSWTMVIKDYRCDPETCNFRVEGSEACEECLAKGTVSLNCFRISLTLSML